MYVFLILCGSLIPAMLLLIGGILKKHPPKKINWYLGYRTARSMKSPEAWNYAQTRLGQLWRQWGLPLWGATLLALLPFRNATEDLQGLALLVVTGVQLAVIIATIPKIEKELKERFEDTPIK